MLRRQLVRGTKLLKGSEFILKGSVQKSVPEEKEEAVIVERNHKKCCLDKL